MPAIDEPECFIQLLIASHRFKGMGIGGNLLEFARNEAQQRGAGVFRVDCYASDDEALIRYYESQGFRRTDRIAFDNGVSVQVLDQRL